MAELIWEAVYVDKTYFVWLIAWYFYPQILIRPPGFGKSTLLSALEELFLHGVAPYDGHDSWFKGLYIEARWQDQGQYLVLHLNFAQLNTGCTTFAEFERQLLAAVSAFGRAHALKMPSSPRNFWALFEALRTQLSTGEVVVKSEDFLRAALINPTAHTYSLLFQTGYLTLSQPFTLDGTEHLVCPNQGTRLALDRLLAQL